MLTHRPENTGHKLPIKVWVPETAPSVEDNVWKQLANLADHPLARKWICAMPDFHLGYGMPIGGVLATQGGVIPNAVGVDIGCGMIAARTAIAADDLDEPDLEALRLAIMRRVPVGFNRHTEPQEVPAALHVRYLVHGQELPIVSREYQRASYQLGTLGGGNHFIELQRCQEDGSLWIMLHSGSRNLGKQVCDHYNTIAKEYMRAFCVDVDRDLAFLLDSVPEYHQYLSEMHWCMGYADASRKAMLQAVYDAFGDVFGELPRLGIQTTTDNIINTHHNFAAIEHHDGMDLMIHRKGAVKAETGTLVIIPGSMGTASYIARGLGSRDSFHSCSHGAGRVMGRTFAKNTITQEQAVTSMEGVVCGDIGRAQYDEMPDCYKKIEEVMDAQADLVQPVHRLTPLMVVKG